jgi:hypothetical protein
MQNAFLHIYFCGYLSQIFMTVQPQTNIIGRKKRVSAFQWYGGRGVSDRVYIGKSTYIVPKCVCACKCVLHPVKRYFT